MNHRVVYGQFAENQLDTFTSQENISGQFVQGVFLVTVDFSDELKEDEPHDEQRYLCLRTSGKREIRHCFTASA